MPVVLQIVGMSLISLAILHVFFPQRFGWKVDLAKLSLLNRQIFLVHCFFICVVLIMMGLLCLVWPHELLSGSPLAKLIAAALAIFWTLRALAQWFFYDRTLWQGKRFETTMHILFSLLWLTYVGVFSLVYFRD